MPATPTPDDDAAATRLEDRETVRLPNQRRPAPRAVAPQARKAPLALAATVTTTWAAVVSLLPVLVLIGLAYAVDGTGVAVLPIIRFGLAAWLLAHGVPVHTGIGPVSLAPLALSLVAGWRVIRAGVHTARAIGARRGSSPWPALAAGSAVGVVYGLLGTVAALIIGTGPVSVPAVRAGLTLGLFGLLAGVVGALIEARVMARWVVRMPVVVRDALRTGVVAAVLILGTGAALAGIAVAVSGGDAAQIIHDYHTGVAGQFGLLLVCGVYAPNVLSWASAYLIGPGFVIGQATSVSVAGVTLGPLPAVPVLAGIPGSPAAGWGSLLLGVPLVAAMVAGALQVRRTLRRPDTARSWTGLLCAAVLSGPVAGLLLGLDSIAGGGSLGSGGLAVIGSHAVWVASIGAVVVSAGATLAAALTKLLSAVRRNRA